MKLLVAFLTSAAVWASPTIKELFPRGAQQGKTVQLTVRGEQLTPDARLETNLPGNVSRLVPPADAKPATELTYLVELNADAPVGVYPVRVITGDGLSNILMFAVGTLPEVAEQEKPHAAATEAQLVTSPVTVNGAFDGSEIDYYAIDIKIPQKLVVEIDARRNGSAIDPAFEIEDSHGKVIAKNDDGAGAGVDARLEVAFAKPGRYFVRAHDSKYSTQAQNFYRLKIGQWAFAEQVFPAGGTRGTEIEVTLSGGNLAKPMSVRARLDGNGPMTALHLPGSASLPLLLRNEDAPGFLYGRLPAKHRIKAQPGEEWLVETSDAEMIVTGADGKKIASRNDVGNPDQALPFTVPPGVTEVTVTVQDLLGREGGTYRMHAQKSAPDFVLQIETPLVNIPAGGTAIIPVAVRRRGYEGAVRVIVENAPPGVAVGGGDIPSEAAAQSFTDEGKGFRTSRGMLTLTANADIAPSLGELRIVGIADDGRRFAARGIGYSNTVRGLRQGAATGAALGLKLPYSTALALPATLTVANRLVRISQGVSYPVQYKLSKRGMVRDSGKVNNVIANAVGNIRVLQVVPGKAPGTGVVPMTTNFATPVSRFNILLATDAEVNGKMQIIYSPAVEFDVVPGFSVYPSEPQVAVESGGKFSVRGRIRREPTFEGGAVKLSMQELPETVSCQDAEIAAEAVEFTIACEAKPGTAAGVFSVFIVSSALDVGTTQKSEYKGPDTSLKLNVTN